MFSDTLAGGAGAGLPYTNGMSVTSMDPLGAANMPAETAELFFPIAYHKAFRAACRTQPGRPARRLVRSLGHAFLGGGRLGMETARAPSRTARRSQRPATTPPSRRSNIHADWLRQGDRRPRCQGRLEQPAAGGALGFHTGDVFMFEAPAAASA